MQTVATAGEGANIPAVVTQGLSKQFNEEYAVRGLTFSVAKGIIFGFIGPSGSGKTTTVRLLTGIYAPSEGKVQLLGLDPQHFSTRMRAKIGYMPQLFVLYPDLSVWENMNFAASLYGMSPLTRSRRLNQLLEFVELKDHRWKLARNISGGMQRRLALAATLVHNPEVIFLDEPTAGIDPILRKKFWEHFRELQTAGHTIFVTTQYVGEAAYCDYVGVMAEGRMLVVDTPTGLRHRTYGGEIVDLQTKEPLSVEKIASLQSLPMIKQRLQVYSQNGVRMIVPQASTAIPEIITWAKDQGLTTDSVKEYVPPFDDVFVQLVQMGENHG